MKRLLAFCLILSLTVFLFGLSVTYSSISSTNPSLNQKDEIYRERLVKINSRPLTDGSLVDPVSGFPFDNGYLKESDRVEGLGQYTSPTNIGLYLTYLVGIHEGFIVPFNAVSKDKALERIEKILSELAQLAPSDKWNGLYYWMVMHEGKWTRAADGKGNFVISQPDNANLFAGIITVLGMAEEALKEKTLILEEKIRLEAVRDIAKKLILESDWKKLYDPERGLYYLAYIPDQNAPLRFGVEHKAGEVGAPIYVENLMDEWRLGVLIAYAVSDLPGSHTRGVPWTSWTQLDREKRSFETSEGKKIEAVASGHGGMFQQRLPLLFVPEMEWSNAFRDNHNNFYYIAVDYAQKLKQPFLFSASTNPEGTVEYVTIGDNLRVPVDTTYDEFGVKPLALKLSEEFNVVAYEKGRPIGDVTPFRYASSPHALALGFLTHPEETIALFKRAELAVKIFMFPGGIPDAYGIEEGKPERLSFRTLVLDQLMLVLALQGNRYHPYFVEGLKTMGAYEKAKDLYASEEKNFPNIYPLKAEKYPKIKTDYAVYLGLRESDYLTALKFIRESAMDFGFMLLREEDEKMLADKFSRKRIDRENLREFFQGNLAATLVGENGTFKAKKAGGLLIIPQAAGWMGDRVAMMDVSEKNYLVFEIDPVKKQASFNLELKGRASDDFFPDKKFKVSIPRGTQTVKVPLPKTRPQYLTYIAISDPTQSVSIKSIRLE